MTIVQMAVIATANDSLTPKKSDRKRGKIALTPEYAHAIADYRSRVT